MTDAVEIAWIAAGCPTTEGPRAGLLTQTPGACAVSGYEHTFTAPAVKALGGNLERSALSAPDSDKVGPAALWAMSGRGKSSLRLWSIVADLSPRWVLCNRSDPTPIVATLADPPALPWIICIAVSGQKHLLPYTPVNRDPGSWRVRFENTTVSGTPDMWRRVHGTAVALRKLGVPPAHIGAGTPGPAIKTRDQLAAWRHLSAHIQPWTGSPLLTLALWTITKKTLEQENPTP